MISKGNHVKFSRFNFYFSFVQRITKQLWQSSFRDIQNNQGLGKSYSPQPSASSQDNLYLNLDYSGYPQNLIK